MAAEIKPASCQQRLLQSTRKLSLLQKIEGFSGDVLAALLIEGKDVVVTASADKSIRVWQRRDTGQFWPSVCEYVPSTPTCLYHSPLPPRLLVGLENGTVSEFELSADCNGVRLLRDYLSHLGRVNSCHLCAAKKLVLSVGGDNFLQCYCSTSGSQIAQQQIAEEPTCLSYDALSHHVFVGDSSGAVSLLQLDNNSFKLVTQLLGHTSGVRTLLWEQRHQWLFSGGNDHLVIMWDVGGGQGAMYKLHAHTSSVVTISYCRPSNQLISGSEDGMLAVWDMTAERLQPVEWAESDTCQLCEKPFFWNIRAMYNSKQLGLNRQHHCRNCGKAVCGVCADRQRVIPPRGHELPARVCRPCDDQLAKQQLQPLCTMHMSRQQLVDSSLDSARGKLLTAGRKRQVKLWELESTSTDLQQ